MKEIFSERLKRSMKAKQLTQRQLGMLIGKHQIEISRYITNANTPSIETLCKLCKALNVSADYLIGLSDDPRNDIERLKAELLEQIRSVLE